MKFVLILMQGISTSKVVLSVQASSPKEVNPCEPELNGAAWLFITMALLTKSHVLNVGNLFVDYCYRFSIFFGRRGNILYNVNAK